MEPQILGELAGIGTSLCFSIGPTFFTLAGRKIGSVNVNRIRLILAVLVLTSIHYLAYGQLVPLNANSNQWAWLSISGLIGLTLGDAALFQALVLIGPRITLLVFSIAPIIGILFGWVFFKESLGFIQLLGILITLVGVSWVVIKRDKNEQTDSKINRMGLLYAFLGAMGQALGLFSAKMGLTEGLPPLSGQVIRMVAGMSFIWLWTFITQKARPTVNALRENPAALKYLLIATLVGPVVGVWFSMVSVQSTELGIASTLQALPPIFMIPISIVFFKEKIGWQAILATFVSITGIAIIFLS